MIRKWVIIVFLFGLSLSLNAQHDFARLRTEMVKSQIAARGITDIKVLEAFRSVERHLFVPEKLKSLAYGDYPLSIGEGQTISQPYIVALMTDLLKPDKESRVLEVGTGSGYQAAILGELVAEVYTIEIVESLHIRAEKLLEDLEYNNIYCRFGDGYKGWEARAPFDAIIVTCAPSEVPESLTEQLAEGGRMIIPVGGRFVQELVLLIKKKGKLKQQSVASVLFVPMLRDDGIRYD
ncbi:MAG: protein-L-isoaspartate(D-aspartate) O-methyltransferase [Bacteroidales bacterium]|nr:protein-L-isoaspartate(D-aspartate) O-methyltransferase [Bacteroidales bacterium]